MTGIVVLLYIAIGIGCGLIRLSAVAVGIIAMVPAVVGAFAVSDGGLMAVVMAVLAALLLIEGAYFLTMLLVAKFWTARPAAESAENREAAGDLRFQRKPQGEEP